MNPCVSHAVNRSLAVFEASASIQVNGYPHICRHPLPFSVCNSSVEVGVIGNERQYGKKAADWEEKEPRLSVASVQTPYTTDGFYPYSHMTSLMMKLYKWVDMPLTVAARMGNKSI